jgi:DNA topoisomerase-2
MTDKSSLGNKYQLKSEHKHILDNPDTYIGSIDIVENPMWILDDNNETDTDTETKTEFIKEKTITYIPALLKLFDEGIVNCRDHYIRMKQQSITNPENKQVTYIDIHINKETGTITMINDGNGIDVAQHPEHNIWIPELIFGHLRTSTNYDKEEKKLTGGKNGFGFKLVLIWSTYGYIETFDHIRGLKYSQEFTNNLIDKSEPKITKCKTTKPYTKIVFTPDYKRLGIDGLSDDMVALFKKRIYDIAAITDKKVKVKYNSNLIGIKDFTQYVNLYIGDNKRIYEENGERWEYIASLSPTHEFTQISFVNGIHTPKGGKHVEYILNQIIRKIITFIEKKKKQIVNSTSIKEQLILFVRCDIENPSFDSQSKECLTTPSSKFGSSCNVSDKFIEKLASMGIMESACAITDIKKNKEAAKKTDGSKTRVIRGIHKLMDANWAGTEKSKHCVIIFCEGDSAQSGIKSGLSTEDRNIYGVYPLKGKVLNVRGENREKISNNKEITEIKKILGLEDGKEYTPELVYKCLRYSKVLVMTDSDVDGSHIKGLIINLFHVEWPSLLKIDGFMGFMNTPILKARKLNKELSFYNNGEYETWKSTNPSKDWSIKYYKGLGTSTRKEFQEYFNNKKLVEFVYNKSKSDDTIDLAFNKKRPNDRKQWLDAYDRTSYLDTSNSKVNYEEFINKELIHFSHADCDRSIPNMMDGLKVSQRKILFAAFKKNLNTDIKVAQFSGYVSEHSCYHNGEQSLNLSIISMAQNYVGSNNINLLVPVGQFGTRQGNDASAPRYIFTKLNKITNCLFPIIDNKILTYLTDDGVSVEPIYYTPILPMVLINGSNGIATGYSTDVMCYNPLDIIKYIKNKLNCNEEDNKDVYFVPFYEGFTGSIIDIQNNRFLIKGKYERIDDDTIRITEIPIGTTTESYKEHLEFLNTPPPTTTTATATKQTGKKTKEQTHTNYIIKEIIDMSKDINIDYTIILQKGKLQELESNIINENCNELERVFKLFTTNTTTNMYLFNSNGKLVKYNSVRDIIDDYYQTRFEYYQIRKNFQIKQYEEELILLSNKRNFIQESLNGTIDLRRKKKDEVFELLNSKKYVLIDESYNYLIKLPVDIVTEENVDKIQNDYNSKIEQLEYIKNMSIENIWLIDIQNFETEYQKYTEERRNDYLPPSSSSCDKSKIKQSLKKSTNKSKKV